MRFLLTLALLCGCATFDITRPVSNAPDLVSWLAAPAGTCFTPCGMHTTVGDCESLQRYEGRVVRTLSKVPGLGTEEAICSGLAGFEIKLHRHDPVTDKGCSPRGWLLFPGFCAGGYTDPESRTITLSQPEWEHSLLGHEVVHAVGGLGHCRWRDPHLVVALYDLTGEVDGSTPEASCSP